MQRIGARNLFRVRQMAVIVGGTVATWAALKYTLTVSLGPNPVPLTATRVVGGPTVGVRLMLVVAAAPG